LLSFEEGKDWRLLDIGLDIVKGRGREDDGG